MTTATPLGTKYTNKSYPGYSVFVPGSDLGKFLQKIGSGLDDSDTTRGKMPTGLMLSTLRPMLRDRDFVFSLTFQVSGTSSFVEAVTALASTWIATVPRQSAAYVVSTPYLSLPTKKDQIADSGQVVDTKYQEADTQIKIATQELDKLGAASLFRVWDMSPFKKTPDFKTAIDALIESDGIQAELDKLKSKLPATPCPKFLDWMPEPSGTSPSVKWDSVKSAAVRGVYRLAGRVLDDAALGDAQLAAKGIAALINDIRTEEEFEDIVASINAFVEAYCTAFKDWLNSGAKSNISGQPVTIRLYPRSVFISHAVRPVVTTKLSENSFIQTAGRPDNIVIQFQDCIAFDTLDTQWAQLYRELFKIIVDYGNPECTVRYGRHKLDHCYLYSAPQIPDVQGGLTTFPVVLISTASDDSDIGSIDEE